MQKEKNELAIKPTKNGWLVEECITSFDGAVVDTGDVYCFTSQSDLGEFVRNYYATVDS